MTLTQEEAHRLFEYKDGVLLWKVRPAMRSRIGDEVGGTNGTKNPYLRGRYKEHRFLVHQVIFLMQYGYVPKVIDHIDGNIHNNRIENLREVTKLQNSHNCKKRKNNTTGVPNVYWYAKTNSYFVKVMANRKTAFSGYFKDLELAELVASEARTKFHDGYNRF
jgi:HNH endonuclease